MVWDWGSLLKKVTDYPIPRRDITDQTLPGQELFNYSWPGRVWPVTSRLGKGKLVKKIFSVGRGTVPSFVCK
jgi:hypothetical protein